MAVLTRAQIKAYQDSVPNKGIWNHYRTAKVVDDFIRDMADSFALLSEVGLKVDGAETFLDDGADVYINLGASTSVRRVTLEYHMGDGTYQEHGRLGVGSDGANASVEQIRQGVVGEDIVSGVTFSADVSGGQVRLGLITGGAGASVTFSYSLVVAVTV